MKFVFTNLFDLQLEHLLSYIQLEYGNRKAEEVRDKITFTIYDIPPFTSKYPLYMIYRGYEIPRIAQKRSYILGQWHNPVERLAQKYTQTIHEERQIAYTPQL